MKFIEIDEGISVRKDEIIAVQRLGIDSCRIILENVSYESTFSYRTILALLEMDKIEEQKQNVSRETPNLWGQQHWVG